ncbi:MAG TPA: tRNA (N6-threonylcarbamoyladenosine(37)-N6)-methyltransferase TrmO [Patescibacteria group bacterium]|nr:tRNA (N6-threonylcarbamoyladenosine(37)-N6)-methyltransferase TrmO [Patescibacteria group bacterium]
MGKGEVEFIGEVTEVDGELSKIVLTEKACPGLLRIEEHSHLYILYWFHQRDTPKHRNVFKVIPRRHGETAYRGVFASHSPSRPNPIGLTLVELVSVEGCALTVKGLDAFEGSPVVDIKPRSSRDPS